MAYSASKRMVNDGLLIVIALTKRLRNGKNILPLQLYVHPPSPPIVTLQITPFIALYFSKKTLNSLP